MANGNGFSRVLPWVGVMVLCFGAASTSGVSLWRIDAQAEELKDLGEGVDENEESIEEIQRILIRRQGEQALQVQRIESEVTKQGDKVDEILRLLQRNARGD